MRYNYSFSMAYTWDPKHGFGILFAEPGEKEKSCAFFEDDTFLRKAEAGELNRAIQYLLSLTDTGWMRLTRKEEMDLSKLLDEGAFSFSSERESSFDTEITAGSQTIRVHTAPYRHGYGYTSDCSCGKTRCVHGRAASIVCRSRIRALFHLYVASSKPVYKGLFLDPALTDALDKLNCDMLDEPLFQSIRNILHMLELAQSDDYCRLFHEHLMDMNPPYGEYDAHFLESRYPYFLMALFENLRYRRVVLDTGLYTETESYESRQRRSNRVCFKRLLKEYRYVVRELDDRQNYGTDTYKEALLKYREDLSGLFRYYAEGKEHLSLIDVPYLEKIAERSEKNPDETCIVAEKLDELYEEEDAVRVFRRLVDTLPMGRKVEVYSRIHHITMPMEMVRTMPVEEQRKLINSAPLTAENFLYFFENVLAGSSNTEKGRYILSTMNRLPYRADMSVKNAIVKKAASLPDNRLLLAYAAYRLNLKSTLEAAEGEPERELAAYFLCDYQVVNEEGAFYTIFRVSDPEADDTLFTVREEEGRLSEPVGHFPEKIYSAGLIRKVCLSGRQEAYEQELWKNREAAEIWNFEKDHRKFAGEYRKLCDSLKDEKFLFTEASKARIDWLIERDGTSNALAFKVGHRKMYVVKDAVEFIRAFKSGQTVEYGKDLILTHDTDHLNEADAAVMKFLMAAKYTKGKKSDKKNKRYITVGDSVLSGILEMLAGRTVMYQDAPCLLRLNPESIRIRIDGHYILSADIEADKQEFLNLSGRGFLLTKDDSGAGAVLDLVKGSAEEIGLIDLVTRNPAVCIRPILEDFKRNIYARFFEMIDLDKGIERDFVLSRIRLNTYFDFEKSVITAKTKILRDGKEVPAAGLTERIDQVKVELLEGYLSSLGFTDGTLADEGCILAFFKLDFARLKSLTNVYLSESLQNKEIKSVGKPVIRVSYQNHLMQVFLEKSEFSESELEQIIAGIRKKKKYILLGGDRIIDLDSETAQDLGEAVRDFGMDPKDLYRKKTVSMVTAVKAFSHERSCRVDKYLRDMIEAIRHFKEADLAVPKLNGELRDYQVEGFKWMRILSEYGMGGILADDMGLGKTIQVIALIRADRTRKPSLVVCPKSLVFNWLSEFARFDGTTRVEAIYGTDIFRSEKIASIDYSQKAVYITSYDSLRNDIGKYTGDFNYGILDEAQYIKNVHALKTKSVKELKAAHRFALTGTPIENSVVDLWSIFDYIMPGYFEELSRFRENENAVIARKSAPFILRRVKEDVLEDLPAKYERVLAADMSDGQRKLYEAMRQEAGKQLESGGKAFDLLPYLTRLRQICVDPGMFVEDYTGGSGKLDMLSWLIPEYLKGGHRILIFSQFVKALEAVNHRLKSLGIDAFFLSGATPAKDRAEMIDSFNNGSGTDVFLISLKAGGTGLNLTGADTVIHLDPWWNVAAENQASDRTHRIGQTRNVEIIKLIVSDSIEQRVIELQDIKKEVIHQVISDDDGSVTSARLEDIAFVLQGE